MSTPPGVDLEPLHQRPPAEITRGEVRNLINSIATRSGWVANRVVEVVRRVYSWSVENDRVAASPVVGIRKPHDEEPSERVLSTEEIHAVWRALDFIEPDHADIIRLLFLTGVRPHAILGMRRRELEQLDDPKSARWTIPGGLSGRQKNRKPQTVPLVSQALDIIKPRLEQHDQECVFQAHRAGRSPHRLFSSKVARALRIQVDAVAGRKVPRWRVYDIRHTVATRLREDLKVSRDIVSLVLGHIQEGPEATRVYDRAELLSERRAALTAWAAWLRRVVLKPPQKKPIGLVEAART